VASEDFVYLVVVFVVVDAHELADYFETFDTQFAGFAHETRQDGAANQLHLVLDHFSRLYDQGFTGLQGLELYTLEGVH